MDKSKKPGTPFAKPLDTPVSSSDLQELVRRIRPDTRRGEPGADAIASALESAQRLAAEMEAEDASSEAAPAAQVESANVVCSACGHSNRRGNKFCSMCGAAAQGRGNGAEVAEPSQALAVSNPYGHESMMRPPATQPSGNETHHYHHHYHHHYFPGGQEAAYARPADPAREMAREDKLRSASGALRTDNMSRAEAGVRAITQEWVLACNTKHLDDLLELYVPDALVLRSNYPPIRGAAAVREFFFGALDAGLGEVEIEPLRIEVVGDLAYEAGRCKALIPSSTGKRREERGKYLWVCSRQPNGEWKISADCWSSDLTLTMMESDIPAGAGVKMGIPRKNP